jgi:hypothetical protein
MIRSATNEKFTVEKWIDKIGQWVAIDMLILRNVQIYRAYAASLIMHRAQNVQVHT